MPDDLAAALDRADSPYEAFSYVHAVSFQDTNLVGNVYFAHYLSWQGRCRELFLQQKAPEVLEDLAGDLRLVTLSASANFYDELRAFDTVEVRMRLAHQRQHKIGLSFEYLVARPQGATVCAEGAQQIGCMRTSSGGLIPTPPPPALLRALTAYRSASA